MFRLPEPTRLWVGGVLGGVQGGVREGDCEGDAGTGIARPDWSRLLVCGDDGKSGLFPPRGDPSASKIAPRLNNKMFSYSKVNRKFKINFSYIWYYGTPYQKPLLDLSF